MAPDAQGPGEKREAENKEQVQAPVPRVWQPTVDSLGADEELRFDPAAYDCLHAFRLPWPCLSLDILRDEYGAQRTHFPHALFLAAGTQASTAGENSVSLVKLTNLVKMKQRKTTGEDDDSDDDSSSDEEEEEEGDGDGDLTMGRGSGFKPRMQVLSVAHHGGVNRLRCMPQRPQVCAAWGDTGRVQVLDLTPQWRQLADAKEGLAQAAPARQAPMHIFGGHKEEGFAVDWSPVTAGRLATGDCSGAIFKWEPPAPSGGSARWAVDAQPFRGHEGSVEDIQWSPSEGDVFASCGVDGHICIWDARAAEGARGCAALRLKAHSHDVNVISWNLVATCMLASGCDDGTFRIWDLRSLTEDGFVAHFSYHKKPVTSIEWSPHESSVLVVTCADDQTTVWDLALERDAEEEAEFAARQQKPQAAAPEDLPPQLLFQHMGQRDVKEGHWHSQIPGMLVTTSLDGFNAFKPANV